MRCSLTEPSSSLIIIYVTSTNLVAIPFSNQKKTYPPLPGYLPPPFLLDHRVTKVRSPETHSSHKKSLCATFWLSILWSISKLGRYWCNACLGQRKSTRGSGGIQWNSAFKKKVAEASIEGGEKHAGGVFAGKRLTVQVFNRSVEGPLKLDNKYSSKHPTISLACLGPKKLPPTF